MYASYTCAQQAICWVCYIIATMLDQSLSYKHSRVAQEDLVPVARELGIGFLAYSPLGRGLLTGALKTRADVSKQQAAFNPRMAEEHFDKVNVAYGIQAWVFDPTATQHTPGCIVAKVRLMAQNLSQLLSVERLLARQSGAGCRSQLLWLCYGKCAQVPSIASQILQCSACCCKLTALVESCSLGC